MSQTKIPTLRVYTKEDASGVSTGANTIVELDGKRLPISFLKIECKAKAVTKVMMEMYVQLDIDLDDVIVDIKDQFVRERTRIISEMLDNPKEGGIYQTTKAYAALDDLFDRMAGTKTPSGAQKLANEKPRHSLSSPYAIPSEKIKEVKTTGIFVDLGYTESTRITVIRNDDLMESITLHPKTDMEEIEQVVVNLATKYDINEDAIKIPRHPVIKAVVKERLISMRYHRQP